MQKDESRAGPLHAIERSRIHPFWRGQLFLFDKPQAVPPSPRAGQRLLWIVLGVEFVVRPLVTLGARRLAIADRIWWPLVLVTSLTLLVCWLAGRVAGIRPSQLGIYPWRCWSPTERYYTLQTIPLAIVIFSVARWAGLRVLWTRANLGEVGLFVFVPQMIWGGYQELLYRGMLQTELVRRWGSLRGILASNLIFTFGPLHARHFLAARGNPSHLWIFAAIFAIGLLFAVLFRRSGNLTLIGLMHGLGDWFIDGLARVSSMTG